MEKRRQGIRDHLVLVPCPFQGHMKPMLHLANLLHSKGFSITIIHSQSNSPNPSHYPHFFFRSLGDSSHIQSASDGDFVPFISALNLHSPTIFRDLLLRMHFQDPVLSIIHDSAMYFPVTVADELDIPRIVLRTSSAAAGFAFALSILKQQRSFPFQENESEEALVEFPSIRGKDMPVINTFHKEARDEFLARVHHGTKTASAIVWNTFRGLEQTTLEKIEQLFSVPNFPLGPLHKHSGASLTSFATEDHSCIAWLDQQAPSSVIYVSIGSLITTSESELVEMAWGLANSGQPFLWVVRPGLVNGSSNAAQLLPKEFKETTNKRGRVISWAPQEAVLAHRSVGGFWTHSGWNSTVESISEGVPMLCSPIVGDQRVNARFVSHVWRTGIQLEDGVERGKIEKAIKRLMVDEEGAEMKKRAMDLKDKVASSLRQGGSSSEFLHSLVDFIKGKLCNP
ncbi:hypothetical protein PVL29_010711 [Vitis rotundifolia]|nr:hypothetical protein PVL29_010711 [Vitis rotundifolia]